MENFLHGTHSINDLQCKSGTRRAETLTNHVAQGRFTRTGDPRPHDAAIRVRIPIGLGRVTISVVVFASVCIAVREEKLIAPSRKKNQTHAECF
jgi:hypothetical protein